MKSKQRPRVGKTQVTPSESVPGLTHVDTRGHVRMVAIGDKPETARSATAEGVVEMAAATVLAIAHGGVPKGDVLATARIAAIAATKRTADLIPLCHPLRITGVVVTLAPGVTHVKVRVAVSAFDRTGVEMEALTAVSVACLTIIDMCKAIDREMRIANVELVEKLGGRRGPWRKEETR